MKVTAEEFDQSFTTDPELLEWYSKSNRDKRNKTPEDVEKIKNFRLAFGYILGVDFPGGSTTPNNYNITGNIGPNDEQARTDRFVVFYKNGTYDFGRPACSWVNQLPQGFGCAKGSENIGGCSVGGFERFVPVPCDEIVLKVANQDECPSDQMHYGPHSPRYPYGNVNQGQYNKDDFDGEDCFAGVRWHWFGNF